MRGVLLPVQVAGTSSAKGKGVLKRTVYISGNTLDDNAGKAKDGKDEVEDKAAGPPWKQPEIGDLRVRWEMITPQTVSILGAYGGDGVVEPWLGPGDVKVTPEKSLESVFLLRSGSFGISELVSSMVARNANEAWDQRMFGFGTMTMGSFLFCHFMEYTTDYADIVAHVRFLMHISRERSDTFGRQHLDLSCSFGVHVRTGVCADPYPRCTPGQSPTEYAKHDECTLRCA
eukprot:COSAG02_NODE_1236_length_13732_cov_5.596787_4_plen_230_part_00